MMVRQWLLSLRCWRKRQRDLRVLWPIIKCGGGDLDHAKALFLYHAARNWAWLVLGEAEIVKRVDALE